MSTEHSKKEQASSDTVETADAQPSVDVASVAAAEVADEKTATRDSEKSVEPSAKRSDVTQQRQTRPAAAPSAVVSGGPTDDVLLSRCVYRNHVTRKSLTVHHLQRRLFELGYVEAHTDKDGWYGDHTMRAVKSFQHDRGLPDTGIVDAATFTAVFDGDHNVTVVLDA